MSESHSTVDDQEVRYVAIDCETSGLTDHALPADHPSQPRLAHLAMVYLDGDLNIERESDQYVKPDGWEMSMEAMSVNGLTSRFLNDFGRPIGEVLEPYEQAIKDGYIVCAWNAVFDLKILRGECRRVGHPDLFEQTPNICLMRAYKEYRKIWKGYKLADACAFFDIPYERHHRAPADALAAVEVFRKLKPLGAVPEAKVHYSKDHEAILARGVAGQ